MTTEAPLATISERSDANRIAMRALKAILGAAKSMQLTVEGTSIDVRVERLPATTWPVRGLDGLDGAVDGPLPGAVRLICTWVGGSTELLMSVAWWQTKTVYRHLLGLRTAVASSGQEIAWITVALQLRKGRDGESIPIPMQFSAFKRRDEDADDVLERQSYPLKDAVARSGLPLISPWRVEVCSIRVPSGEVAPSPSDCFRRVVHLALLKLPFFVRGAQQGYVGAPPFTVKLGLFTPNGSNKSAALGTTAEPRAAPATDERRDGIWPLPGGVRQYKQTLDTLLAQLQEQPLTEEGLHALLQDRYEVTGATARTGYTNILLNLGVAQLRDGRFELTPSGEAYLRDPQPRALFELLHRAYSGLLEVLEIANVLGRADTTRTREILSLLLETEWKTNNQSSFRRNWLLSLGCTDRRDDGDALTELGREVLRDHAAEVASIRGRLDEIVAERGLISAEPPDDVDPDSESSPGATPTTAPVIATAAPSAWDADRLDLKADRAVDHTKDMELPRLLLEQACAALSAGKHLLLVGPPGTGKTELARALTEAARSDGYCSGAFVATASADWTTFDTIGGYALQKDHSLTFPSMRMVTSMRSSRRPSHHR